MHALPGEALRSRQVDPAIWDHDGLVMPVQAWGIVTCQGTRASRWLLLNTWLLPSSRNRDGRRRWRRRSLLPIRWLLHSTWLLHSSRRDGRQRLRRLLTLLLFLRCRVSRLLTFDASRRVRATTLCCCCDSMSSRLLLPREGAVPVGCPSRRQRWWRRVLFLKQVLHCHVTHRLLKSQLSREGLHGLRLAAERGVKLRYDSVRRHEQSCFLLLVERVRAFLR